jgi:hypothetical protein
LPDVFSVWEAGDVRAHDQTRLSMIGKEQ